MQNFDAGFFRSFQVIQRVILEILHRKLGRAQRLANAAMGATYAKIFGRLVNYHSILSLFLLACVSWAGAAPPSLCLCGATCVCVFDRHTSPSMTQFRLVLLVRLTTRSALYLLFQFGKGEIRIIMIGLDGAGKTTILNKLKLGEKSLLPPPPLGST